MNRGRAIAAVGLAFIAQPALAAGHPVAGLVLAAFCGLAWRGSEAPDRRNPPAGRSILIAGLAAFVLALAVRVPRLDAVPPVLWDEGIQVYDARCVAAGVPFEPLTDIRYHRSRAWAGVLAGWGSFSGWSFPRQRLVSAVVGSMTVAVTTAIGIRLLGWTGGLAAMVWLAAHPWPVQLSRILLANATVPLAGAVIVLLAGLRPGGLIAAAVSGAIAGFSMWGYAAAVQLPLLAAAAAGWVAPPRRRLAAGLIALGVAAVVSLPAFLRSGESWEKARTLSLLGSPAALAGNLAVAARMFHIEGDPDLRHQYPGGAPVGSSLTGPLLTLGLVLLAAGRDRRRGVLLAGWLLLGLSPGLVSEGGARDGFRQAGAVPAVALVIGLGASALPAAAGARLGSLLALGLVGGSAAHDLRAYFVTFPADPAIRVWYRDWALTAGNDLAAAASARPITICGPLPLSRHGIERAVLFDGLRTGRIVVAPGGCPAAGARTVYRDPWGEPQAVLVAGSGRVRYLTVLDVSADADALRASGRPGEAVAVVTDALRYIPDSALLHERLGFARMSAGDLSGAESSFRTAVRLRPRLGASWDGLASALFRRGRYASAERAVREAIRCSPSEPEFRADLERIRRARGW